MKSRKSVLLLFLFFTLHNVKAQQVTDLQFQFVPSVDYNITKKWQVGAAYRYSLYKDLAAFKSSYFAIETKYDITKKWSVATGYRFTTSYQDDSHLLFAAVKYSKKIKRFNLSSTTRYQFKTGSFDANYMQLYKNPSHFFREKINLEYNIPKSKLSIYVAPELFLKLENQKVFFSRMRYNIGGDYKLKYGSTVGLNFFYENKVNPQKTDRIVMALKYNLNINDLTKKSKDKSKKKDKKEEK